MVQEGIKIKSEVSWQGQTSLSHPLKTGVSQSSVLGPLFFAIYFPGSNYPHMDYPITMQMTSNYICHSSQMTAWLNERHLQLNLCKTELNLFITIS